MPHIAKYGYTMLANGKSYRINSDEGPVTVSDVFRFVPELLSFMMPSREPGTQAWETKYKWLARRVIKKLREKAKKDLQRTSTIEWHTLSNE